MLATIINVTIVFIIIIIITVFKIKMIFSGSLKIITQ